MPDPVPALIRAGRDAVGQGLVVASGGNLSARGSDPDTFVVTGRGTHLDRLDDTSFVTMTVDGEARARTRGLAPSSEWRLHQRTYRARPDVDAVIHLHPQYCVLLDALGRRLRLLTLDHVAYLPPIARIPFHPNGSEELADASAEACGTAEDPCNCVVLAHHGCSALGSGARAVDDAMRIALNLESAAAATYRMLLLGDETTEFPPGLRARAIHAPDAS